MTSCTSKNVGLQSPLPSQLVPACKGIFSELLSLFWMLGQRLQIYQCFENEALSFGEWRSDVSQGPEKFRVKVAVLPCFSLPFTKINQHKMDQVQKTLEPCKEFVKDSVRLVKRCTKPDRKGKWWYGLSPIRLLNHYSLHFWINFKIALEFFATSSGNVVKVCKA